MNERLKELVEQAGFEYSSQWTYWTAHEPELERFAELIRQDEAQACAKHYLSIMRDAVEAARVEERKEIVDWVMTGIPLDGLEREPVLLKYTVGLFGEIAKMIRYRGEK